MTKGKGVIWDQVGPELLEAAKDALNYLQQCCLDDRAHWEDLAKIVEKVKSTARGGR